ncbi:hypothetical protein [Streptomyces mirabilis]
MELASNGWQLANNIGVGLALLIFAFGVFCAVMAFTTGRPSNPSDQGN